MTTRKKLESMGEVWFEVWGTLWVIMIALTYIFSDKEFVTTVLWDKIDHIIVFHKVYSLSWKHCNKLEKFLVKKP